MSDIENIVDYWQREIRRVNDMVDEHDRGSRYYNQIEQYIETIKQTIDSLQALQSVERYYIQCAMLRQEPNTKGLHEALNGE